MTARELLLAKREKSPLSSEGAVSTGSTLLNLACTDRPDVGFVKGGYYYLVGDSISGKTWLSLSCFAEACRNPAFDKYRLVFDDVEGGAMMNIRHYFGREVAKRMEPPEVRKGRPVFSSTVESFYYHIFDLLEEKDPFIYVLDSQDALTSSFSRKKFAQQKRASEEGEKVAGSYGDGKAKYHSEHIREVIAGLRKRKSILIVIGQTRDNVSGMGFEKKTRSGGRALRFYANIEIWTSVAGRIKKLVRDKKRTIGVECLAEVRKNRATGKVGKDRAAQIPIYYDYGIDDIGSCVDFLIEERHWRKVNAKDRAKIFEAPELLFQGTRDHIIQHVEAENLEEKVRDVTAKVWSEIESECRIERKRRYE